MDPTTTRPAGVVRGIGGRDCPTFCQRSRKRPRYLTSWEGSFRNVIQKTAVASSSLPKEGAHSLTTGLGLEDLFGVDTSVAATKQMESDVGPQADGHTSPWKHSSQECSGGHGFYSLRLEHRQDAGRNMEGQHHGEERLLLFRSDRPGAIAKIVFSSTIPEPDASRMLDTVVASDKFHRKSDEMDNHGDDPTKSLSPLSRSSVGQPAHFRAKIHALFVKSPYRGFDLGGLLFSQAMACLKERLYHHAMVSSPTTKTMTAVMECRLDAEEDIRRHNQLQKLYEDLGCRVKDKAKITLIHNNDGESYRKIPMYIDLVVNTSLPVPPPSADFSLLTTSPRRHLESGVPLDCSNASAPVTSPSFLPIILRSSSGRRVQVNNQVNDWLLVETSNHCLTFQTTRCGWLQVGNGQNIKDETPCHLAIRDDEIKDPRNETINDTDHTFQLLRVSDSFQMETDDSDSDFDVSNKTREPAHVGTHSKELWMFRSTQHGSFLGVDSLTRQILSTSTRPSFWNADPHNLTLWLSDSNPPKRDHYRRLWSTQCVEYVLRMRERYSTLDRGVLSIKEALDLSENVPADPFMVNIPNLTGHQSTPPSLRTLLFATAELARSAGHPDWVQFVALVHGLATVLNGIDPVTGAESNDDFDWTIPVDSVVVGCKFPESSTHSEFHCLNPDSGESKYQTVLGRYNRTVGLENVLLTWTGNQYLHMMLQSNNGVTLPNEAYALLRLYPLVDWHMNGFYTGLANDDDDDWKPFVADFYGLCQRAQHALSTNQDEWSQDYCDHLWNTHYSLVASKYGASGSLRW